MHSLRTLKFIFIIGFLVVFVQLSVAQPVPVKDSILVWKNKGKLIAADFKYKPDTLAPGYKNMAKMSSLLDIYMYMSPYKKGDTALSYNIYGLFYRYQSWITDTTTLYHEQVHFDISELYARKMRKYLNSLRFHPVKFNKANKRLNQLYREHAAFQVRYDKETHSGLYINMQILWRTNVDAQLDSMKRYESAKGVVIRKQNSE